MQGGLRDVMRSVAHALDEVHAKAMRPVAIAIPAREHNVQDAGAVVQLRAVLEDAQENPMVRHEAAEALGSIAAPECLELLQQVRWGGHFWCVW